MEETTIQTATDNKGRFILLVHQPVGNPDTEAGNYSTAGSHSATEPSGGTARA